MLLGIGLTYVQDYSNAETVFKEAIKIERNSAHSDDLVNIYVNYFKMLVRKGDEKKADEVLNDLKKF